VQPFGLRARSRPEKRQGEDGGESASTPRSPAGLGVESEKVIAGISVKQPRFNPSLPWQHLRLLDEFVRHRTVGGPLGVPIRRSRTTNRGHQVQAWRTLPIRVASPPTPPHAPRLFLRRSQQPSSHIKPDTGSLLRKVMCKPITSPAVATSIENDIRTQTAEFNEGPQYRE
jgi:hypothetical protein